MTYELLDGPWYRSPVHFGPMPGPRQGPNGKPFDMREQPHRILAVTSFLSEAAALERLLPAGMELDGEPVVTVEVQVFSHLAWLAGRGYSTLNVKLPVRFKGKKDQASGQFLVVIWENMADPIISGREELGYGKMFADIAPERIAHGSHTFTASWGGHQFFEMNLSEMSEVDEASYPKAKGDGILHVKYVPGTPHGAPPDAHYVTMTPHGNSHLKWLRVMRGKGQSRFIKSTWEQMPTLFRIVTTLADLPVIEHRGSMHGESRGGKDLSDQRRLD